MPILPALSDTALGNTGSMDLTPKAPTALDDIQKGATINSTNATTQKTQLDMQIEKIGLQNDMLGAVINAAPDKKEVTYQQQLQRYQQAGGDISKLPQHYDESFVTSSAMQSDKALKMMMAMKEFAIMKKNLQNQTQTAAAASGRSAAELEKSGNSDAAQQQIGAATGALDSVKALGQDPADMAPGLSALATGQPQAPGAPQQQPAPPGAAPGQPPASGAPAPSAASSPKDVINHAQSPAQNLPPYLQQQYRQEQMKNWVTYKDSLSKEAATSGDMINNAELFHQNYYKTKYSGPIKGMIGSPANMLSSDSSGGTAASAASSIIPTLIDSPAQIADKAAIRLTTNLLPTLHTPRVTQYEAAYISKSTLQRSLRPEAEQAVHDVTIADAQRGMEHIKFVNALEKEGVYDKGIADSMWNQFISDNHLIDTKTGKVNKENISNWKPYTDPKKIADVISGNSPTDSSSIGGQDSYIEPNGNKTISNDQLIAKASALKLSPDEVVDKYGLQKIASSYTEKSSGREVPLAAIRQAMIASAKSGTPLTEGQIIKKFGLVPKK